MAVLTPSLNSCIRKMTPGEKRFARRLESYLEDDYLCWYDIAVGKRNRYSDFIILHPSRGLLFLEVKDWKLNNIRSINKATTEILTEKGLKVVSNPIEQVRQCSYQVIKKLEQDPQLINQAAEYKGKLIMPYGYGVVLSNITRDQLNISKINKAIPDNLVICKDEMVEDIDPEKFQSHLWKIFNYNFPNILTLSQIDRIRWHLFPEIRINSPERGDIFSTEDEALVEVPDIIKVMDLKQEKLARSLGEGHRVIHGVAGSGKTMILIYRCLYLANLLSKPILVLCYNTILASHLREIISNKGISDRVNVYHFHDWCGDMLRSYHINKPKPGKNYPDQLIECVISAVQKKSIPSCQYGAVIVDEGHDFEPEWLKLITQMVDNETKSLLLLYDDAQSIYNIKKDFSLSSVGIEARGRTTILKINYRNTDEILNFSYKFASKYITSKTSDDDHVPLVEPVAAGRRGPSPYVKLLSDFNSEISYITEYFNKLNKNQNIPWQDMCVLYHAKWMVYELERAFAKFGIPVKKYLKDKKKLYNHKSSTVKLITMHSSKGLEFPVIAICGIGSLAKEDTRIINDAKILYVAMTRATDLLLLTSHVENDFIRKLKHIAV